MHQPYCKIISGLPFFSGGYESTVNGASLHTSWALERRWKDVKMEVFSKGLQ